MNERKSGCIEIDGGHILNGRIAVSGAKNAALPCLFATLLTERDCTLRNLPQVADTATSLAVLASLGKSAEAKDGSASIGHGSSDAFQVPLELGRAMRASILALGPLLALRGQAKVPLPGGCDFGSRPIDIHVRGLRKMGARISMRGGVLHGDAERLTGCKLRLKYPTFTGTENLMMAATLAQGTTVIENAAREPEIVNLAAMLNSMGAAISGAGEATIVIEGVDSLAGTDHDIMPDRIEAGTYLAAVTATQGEITLDGIEGPLLAAMLDKLREAGASITEDAASVRLSMERRPTAVDVTTAPFPGFPSDLQAQMMAVNSIALGTAKVVDDVWKHRFRTADELALLGADISIQDNCATVTGVEQLFGGHVQATDLRASAALVIAGLCATGTTIVHGMHHLQRGYENLPDKLASLGAVLKIA